MESLLTPTPDTIGLVKTYDEVSASKLRGGFYTPDALVDLCLDRALELADGRSELTVLEPSAGDGAFIRGLARHHAGRLVAHVYASELVPEEASKSRSALEQASLEGTVRSGSYLQHRALRDYDVAIGNPPFLRFQFVADADVAASRNLAVGDTPIGRVSNLWIPVFLKALSELTDGGAFSFVVPAEFLTGVSAKVVRTYLVQRTDRLRIDLFGARSFPNVLQEVVILSGRVSSQLAGECKVEVYDHIIRESWTHLVDATPPTWTHLLLRPSHVDAISHIQTLSKLKRFGDVAKLGVATVTGANDFFSVTDDIVIQYHLQNWTLPLLARARQAKGLRLTDEDIEENRLRGLPARILDFSEARQTPEGSAHASAYIEIGEERELHKRYKCRIRSPWYRVPIVKPGTVLLSKRSHLYPRLIANDALAVTTDTIYQGSPLPAYVGREHDIVASFHNTFTLLSAEIAGRSFGGGVLELVPSEVASLLLPLAPVDESTFSRLDTLVRELHGQDSEELVEITDELVTSDIPELAGELLDSARSARELLLRRRLDRAAST